MRNVKVLGFSVLDDFYSLHMSFAQTCHMSYTIDYLSEGRYQRHSVTKVTILQYWFNETKQHTLSGMCRP